MGFGLLSLGFESREIHNSSLCPQSHPLSLAKSREDLVGVSLVLLEHPLLNNSKNLLVEEVGFSLMYFLCSMKAHGFFLTMDWPLLLIIWKGLTMG